MNARPLVKTLVILTLAIGASAPANAQSISAMASDLQTLQTQIASGDKSAYAAQPERLKAMGAAIAAAKPEVWRSKHETDAAVIYLLSGGQPSDIAQLLQSDAVPKSEMPLMRGAVAYVLGDQTDARTLLAGFDPRKLDCGSPVRSPSRNRFSTPRGMGRRRSRCSIWRVCWPPAVWSRKRLCGARSCSSATDATATASFRSPGNTRRALRAPSTPTVSCAAWRRPS